MRILTLRFQRLNSLRDPVVLDFAEGPLAAAGLFAITGPTGAGKSTILDAISLALYNRTPRSQGAEIISRGEREASTEVEFEVRGQVYRTTWAIRLSKPRSKDKAPTPTITMELSQLTALGGKGEILASKLRGGDSVPDRIEALTGLDFKRFMQSMLLAQGDFDAFLVASPTDRSALLEQITGTEIYSQVSKLVYGRHKDLAADIKQRQALLEQQGLPDEAQLAQQQAELLDLQKKAETLAPQLTLLRKQNEAYVQQAKLEQRARGLALRQDAFDAESAVAVRAQRQQHITQHERALPLRDLQGKLVPAREELTDLEKRRQLLAHQQLQTEEKLGVQLQAVATATAALNTARVAQTKSERTAERARGLGQVLAKAEVDQKAVHLRIDKLQQQTAALTAKRASLLEEQVLQQQQRSLAKATLRESEVYAKVEEQLPSLRPVQASWEDASRALQATQQQLQVAKTGFTKADESLSAWRQTQPQRQGYNVKTDPSPEDLVDQLQDESTALAAQLAQLKTFGGLLRTYVDFSRAQGEARQELTTVVEKLQTADAALQALNEQRELATTTLDARRAEHTLAVEAYESVRLQADLREAHGHDLLDGQPCPLCGALEHPALKKVIKPQPHLQRRDALHQQVAKLEAEVKALQQGTDAAQLEVKALRTQQGLVEKQLDDKGLAQHRSTLQEGAAGLEQMVQDKSYDQHLLQELLEVHQRQREQHQTLLAQLTELRAFAKTYRAYQQQLLIHEAAAKQAEEQYEHATALVKTCDQSVLAAQDQLLLAIAKCHLPTEGLPQLGYLERLQDIQANRAKEVRQQELAESKLETLAQQLAEADERLQGLQQTSTTEAQNLAALNVQVTNDQSALASLLGKAPTADALVAAAAVATTNAQAELTTQEQAAQQLRETLAGLKRTQEEVVARSEQLGERIEALQQQLHEQALAASFTDAAQGLAALLSADVVKALREQLASDAREAEQLHTLQAGLAQDRAEWAQVLQSVSEPEALPILLQEAEAAAAEGQRRMGELAALLKRAAADRQRAQAAAAALAKRQEVLLDWTTLNDLIGQADGAKFSRFAQSITLQQLMLYANEYLRKLYPRFSVQTDTTGADDKLAILVCDHYEADQVRQIATVSGGERFLISMSLALAFSRMASRNLSIDTLFIDEGFGTLDGETLDKAIDALERLRHDGKTIGIISHVAALQDRIGTQVHLRRIGSGRSVVEVLA